jgi:ribosomal silencing factor RsfS
MEPILELVIKTLDAHQADQLNVIDIHNYNPLTTYYVIATANNPRLSNALVDYVEEALLKNGFPVHHIERAKES